MPHQTILEDLESDVLAEITLYNDAEVEIVLRDKKEICGLTFYCNVNDLDNGLKKARRKLGI